MTPKGIRVNFLFINLPGPAPQPSHSQIILRLNRLNDLLITGNNTALEADGDRVEAIRIVRRIRDDGLAFSIEGRLNIKRPHETRDVDEDRVTREVHARTDAPSETERQLEVDESRVRCLDETLRTEFVRVREHLRVVHYAATVYASSSTTGICKSESSETLTQGWRRR